MLSNYLIIKRTGELVLYDRGYGAGIIVVKRIMKERVLRPRGYFYPSLVMHKRGLTQLNGEVYDI